MWFFRNKYSYECIGLFNGFTDWHSHILPGVDDGKPDMKSAIEVLERFEELGFSTVWLTPHIMEDMPNRTEDLRQRFSELEAEYKGTIGLHLAAEYVMDNCFEERLDNENLLCIGPQESRMLLIETSYFSPPINLYKIIERIFDKGYQPLIAHPERYIYMDSKDYERLRDMGVLFQCNISSLTGAYGKDASRKFSTFLSKGWIKTLGTDIHRLGSFNHDISQKCITNSQKGLLLNVAEL